MNSPVNFNDPAGHMCSDPEDTKKSSYNGHCEGIANVKTKIGDKMIAGDGKTPGLGSCGGFGQKKCRTSEDATATCIICHVIPKTQPEKPTPSILSSGGDEELGVLMEFVDNIVSPMADGFDIHEAYVLSSSKWYKTPVWSIPSAFIEVPVAGARQYYRDSWWEGYTPTQRTFRVLAAMSEAYVIDKAATAAAVVAAGSGGMTLGPVGAASASGVTSYSVSEAGYSFVAKLNSVWFPRLGLGIY